MQPIQAADYWDETADAYIAGAEPFTALFCRDAVGLAAIAPGMTLLASPVGLERFRSPLPLPARG